MAAKVLSAVLLVVMITGTFAALPPIRCSKGDVPAACLVNPCQTPSLWCEPKKPWECVPNYCNKRTTYLGNTLPPGPCTPVWINIHTKKPVQCPKPEVCIELYAPVCGVDGKTYSNNCYAARAGAAVKYTGHCSFPDKCKKVYKPVCDPATRTTYTNACTAKINGISKFTDGACLGPRCAKCLMSRSCATVANPCKGKQGFSCSLYGCQRQIILDDGSRYTVGLCDVVYTDRASGFPAAECIKK